MPPLTPEQAGTAVGVLTWRMLDVRKRAGIDRYHLERIRAGKRPSLVEIRQLELSIASHESDGDAFEAAIAVLTAAALSPTGGTPNG